MVEPLPSNIDVVIVGGGPAGAATALALQNRRGTQVAILEASSQQEIRIGETVPPRIRSILTQLGVWDFFEREEHFPSLGNCSAWGKAELGFNDFFFSVEGQGWHLNRSRFDASLVEAATESGAIFRRGVRVVGWSKTPEGKWILALRDRDGFDFQLQASFVVDASGHRSVFATWQGAQRVFTDRLLGIAAIFAWKGGAPQDCYTLVEAAELGWWYAARLPGNRAIATLMSDRELLRRYRFSQQEVWMVYLEKTLHVRDLIQGAAICSPLQIQPAFSQYLDRMVGEGWLAVGDAACTFDPLSSAGIYKALRSGFEAGRAIACYLDNGNPEALATYESYMLQQFESYWLERGNYYTMETRWSDSPFWQRRHNRITLVPSKLLHFNQSLLAAKVLQKLDMYLPLRDLRLFCNLCQVPTQASQVISKFMSQTERSISCYRAIEAVQYLLDKQIILEV